jgi:hypothetical protein
MPGGKHNADRRRELQVLVGSPEGVTEAVMMARGFTVTRQLELVRDGLATERVRAGGRMTSVSRVRITESGRRVGIVDEGKIEERIRLVMESPVGSEP